MKRLLAKLLCCAILMATAAGLAYAQGFDRPGGDYTHFNISSGDPATCAARCDRDQRCRAWTFSYPRTVGSNSAVCWLKSEVKSAVEDACCVSGIKGAGLVESRGGPIETAIDRTGGDYKNFELASDPSGESCQKACQGDKKCRAWTYVRPGYLSGAQARCYLKDKITRPRRKPCCVSGVIR